MIEVEKKFILTSEDEARLIKNAAFLNEKSFTDIYYDTDDFFLTSKGQWLRSRDGKFELKIPLAQGAEHFINVFEEIVHEDVIRTKLNVRKESNMLDDLTKVGYTPFCTCRTTRRTYRKDTFTLDLDRVDFQDFIYIIAEIELMVHEKSEVKNATEKIITFAKGHALTVGPVRGKVIEYLWRMRVNHYQALVRAGVVKDV